MRKYRRQDKTRQDKTQVYVLKQHTFYPQYIGMHTFHNHLQKRTALSCVATITVKTQNREDTSVRGSEQR